MLFRASAAEMKRSNAPFSEPAWLEWEGLAEDARLFHVLRSDEWPDPASTVELSSGLESVMVLSLPDSSSAEAISQLDTVSIASLSLPSTALSISLSGST